MEIFYCLRCGAKKYGTKPLYTVFPCDCGGFQIPISRSMITVAQRFHELGFRVREAQDFKTVTLEPEGIRVMLIHVDFQCLYKTDIFRSLPAGWTYQKYPAGEPAYCSVVCCEHKDAFSIIPDNETIKHIIRELDMWIRAELTDGSIAVYRLAGWL